MHQEHQEPFPIKTGGIANESECSGNGFGVC